MSDVRIRGQRVLDNQIQIDAGIPRFNQGSVAVLTAVAFVFQWWPLVAMVLSVVTVTRFLGHSAGLFTWAYRSLIEPRMTSTVRWEPAAPPRFSQTLAVAFLGLAVVLFSTGFAVAGWATTLVVTTLATLSAAARICVGCILYTRWIGR
jgi:hypothetical protein